jgi:hypothetical protein
MRWRGSSLPRRSWTAASGPRCCSCACACRLRTLGPVTKPSIDRPTGGILEALISLPNWPSMVGISLCCSHHGSKRGEGRYRHHKLAHCSLPLIFSSDATISGCINFTSISYFYDMPTSIRINTQSGVPLVNRAFVSVLPTCVINAAATQHKFNPPPMQQYC